MHTFKGILSGALILPLWAWCPMAQAACIANPDPVMRQLQRGVERDATRTLKQIQNRLDAAVHEAGDATRLASLHAVQAEAYGMLELAAEARAAAERGLQLVTDAQDPVRLDLLSQHAENVHDGAGLAREIKVIESARLAQPSGSVQATCLLITRGLLENRQDRADLALVSLTQAYRATAPAPVSDAHVAAAAGLSVVMRGMGDYAQSLALNQEQIDWATAHQSTLSLSVSRFMRAQILKTMGNYAAALVDFARARQLSVVLDDEQGVAYADLRTCETHIDLGDLDSADRECSSARAVFAAAQAADTVKEAQALQARIELSRDRPAAALAMLNAVLDRGGADLSPSHVAALYELRARANAALHRYADAYQDLLEYAQRYARANEAQRLEQAGALRARFETDRAVGRSARLEHELSVSQERTSHQARELRWNAVAVLVSLIVISSLIYFLLTNRRYRQQLIQLASLDGLTGLPNRRRTAELATAALTHSRASRQPLTLAIIDMDHFKIINDRCGHAAGDHVLKEFARGGAAALRDADILGRWGGEEFLLVMPGASLEVAVANLERLRTMIFGIRLPASGVGLRVSLSAGLAAFDNNVKSLDDLIARADSALYAAKNDGRDLVRIADASFITGSHAIRRAQRQ